MPRYKLTLAYDGTNFCGWQKQEPLVVPRTSDPTVPRASGPPDARVGAPIPTSSPDPEAGAAEGPGSSLTPSAPTRAAYSPHTPLIDSAREGRVALRTVQGVLEQAIRQVVREPIELIGASRTDSGVHAKGQVAAFSCEPRDECLQPLAPQASRPASSSDSSLLTPHSSPSPAPHTGWPLARGTDRLIAALNSRLPDDLVVLAAEPVAHTFDPIDQATSKGYSYTFHVSRDRPLWDRHYVHHIWDPRGLNVPAMQQAAAHLVGQHDFVAFAAAGHGRLTTVRTVFSCEVHPLPEGGGRGVGSSDARTLPQASAAAQRVTMHITGNGFLWNMVRIIAGTLMQVGLGQRTPQDVAAILASRDRHEAGPTLPPTGLCLEWIKY